MTDTNPNPTASAAVKSLVERLVKQLEDAAASDKQQQVDLTALRKQIKQPELRQAADAAIKHHADLAAETAALAKQVQSATNPILLDLELLIEVATRGF